ncbi:MAG: O-antigen ligase family protein [Saprospiraceae bacterium]|nr:O-antigen ligase family protein [Saprospiraceae bacterium]
MVKLLQLIRRDHLMLFLFAVIISALIYSPFLLSAAMIGLAVLFTFAIDWKAKGWIRFNPNFFKYFRKFFNSRVHLVITLIFWIVFISGIMTEDWDYWSNRLMMKLPFLVLPILFCGLPDLSSKQYWGLLYFLVFALTVTCIGIGINYLLHFEEINTLMKQGRPMPTPRNHIRFSLILAFGNLAAFYLWRTGFKFKYDWESKAILGAGIFLFLMIHLLSVRSGLAALYLAILGLTIRYAWQTGKYWVGVAVGLGLTVFPLTAYYTIPSFQAKVAYVRYEFWIREHNLGGNYSDLWRIISLRMGMDIGNEHPLVGVGAGNLRQEVKARYAKDYPNIEHVRMPHNQFISLYAGTGLIGLAVFLFALGYPLYWVLLQRRGPPKNKSISPTKDIALGNTLFLGFHIIILASFMVENTIENSMGVGIYAFYLLLWLQVKSGTKQGQE